MAKWAPWEGEEDHGRRKNSLLRFVACCIILANFIIIVFVILVVAQAREIKYLTKVEFGLVDQVTEDW